MVKWSTHAKIHTQTQSNSPSAYKLVESERCEAIFHCYYERTQGGNTDLYSRSPLAREQACVCVCVCVCVSGGLLFDIFSVTSKWWSLPVQTMV